MGEREVANTWKNYWVKHGKNLYISRTPSPIFYELKKLVNNFEGKRILEAGSGIGEISIDIAAEKGEVFLLDISQEALTTSRKFFNERNQNAFYINGSIFNLPFEDKSFDIVWNAGVMEHFCFDKQVKAFNEFARVLRDDGVIITFNPYADAKFYKWGKKFAERNGKWEFGEEYPVKSMREVVSKANLFLEKEYSFLFERQLTFLKYISVVIFHFIKTIYRLTGGKSNSWWQKRFGGYLLISVIRIPNRNS